MSSTLKSVAFQVMLYTGIILVPTIRADALNDLGDLRIVINSAASTIGSPTDPGRNWGLFSSNPSGTMGTADLVQNISTSILRANFNLGSNQTRWVNTTTIGNTTSPINLTITGIDDPYVEYVSTIPNLSTALVALGRSWHRELNRPVYEAIGSLQETISTFSNSLLQAGLIHSNSTIRTIRSGSTLESAQVAWSRILNLPGPSPATSASRRRSIPAPVGQHKHKAQDRVVKEDGVPTIDQITFDKATSELEIVKRALKQAPWQRPGEQRLYTHQELWGERRHVTEGPQTAAVRHRLPFNG